MRGGVIVGILVSITGPLAALAGEPSEAVRPFYLTPGLELEASQRDRFVDPAKKILDQNDVIRQGGEEGCLDPALPFNDTDFDAAEVARTLTLAEIVKENRATVVASFMADKEKQSVQWLLVNESGTWKVADIFSTSKDWALSRFQCE